MVADQLSEWSVWFLGWGVVWLSLEFWIALLAKAGFPLACYVDEVGTT